MADEVPAPVPTEPKKVGPDLTEAQALAMLDGLQVKATDVIEAVGRMKAAYDQADHAAKTITDKAWKERMRVALFNAHRIFLRHGGR